MPTLHVLDPYGNLRGDAPAIVWATALFPGEKEGEDRELMLAHERCKAADRGASAPFASGRGAGAPPEGDITKPATKRAKAGGRVGFTALHLVRPARDFGLNGAAEFTAAKAHRPPLTIQKQDWGRLQPAVHLWAAFHWIETEAYWLADWHRDLPQLAGLLVFAENVRLKLEAHKTRNARRPLLDPARMWRLPVEVDRLDITGPPLRDFELKLIADTRGAAKAAIRVDHRKD